LPRMRPPPVCRFFNGTPGSCYNGDACPFFHQQVQVPSNTYASYSSSYQKKNSWASSYDPNKYKYVAPKKAEDVLTKITRTISNDEQQPEISKTIQIKVKNEEAASSYSSPPDLSCIYSNPADLSTMDRCAFEAASFTMGMIPVVAPSEDLC
ncbi:hypothetical protein PMAYCL1PPCAC_02965, partial [Pristionchus mayeri]